MGWVPCAFIDRVGVVCFVDGDGVPCVFIDGGGYRVLCRRGRVPCVL